MMIDSFRKITAERDKTTENKEDVILFLDFLDREANVGQLAMLLSDAIGLRDMLAKSIEKGKVLCNPGAVHRRLELFYPLAEKLPAEVSREICREE